MALTLEDPFLFISVVDRLLSWCGQEVAVSVTDPGPSDGTLEVLKPPIATFAGELGRQELSEVAEGGRTAASFAVGTNARLTIDPEVLTDFIEITPGRLRLTLGRCLVLIECPPGPTWLEALR